MTLLLLLLFRHKCSETRRAGLFPRRLSLHLVAGWTWTWTWVVVPAERSVFDQDRPTSSQRAAQGWLSGSLRRCLPLTFEFHRPAHTDRQPGTYQSQMQIPIQMRRQIQIRRQMKIQTTIDNWRWSVIYQHPPTDNLRDISAANTFTLASEKTHRN